MSSSRVGNQPHTPQSADENVPKVKGKVESTRQNFPVRKEAVPHTDVDADKSTPHKLPKGAKSTRANDAKVRQGNTPTHK